MKNVNKTLIVFALVILCCMVIVGVVMSIVLTCKKNTENYYLNQLEITEEINQAKNTDEYINAYKIQEQHLGEEDEVLYQ